MNQKALKVLEYDKIIELLTEKATCDLGRIQCQELLPMHDLEEVRLAQRQTADALRRVYAKGSVSFSGTKSKSCVSMLIFLLSITVGHIPILVTALYSLPFNNAFDAYTPNGGISFSGDG